MPWLADSLSSITGQLSNIAKDVLIDHSKDSDEPLPVTEEIDLQQALEKIKQMEERNAAQTAELERLKKLQLTPADSAFHVACSADDVDETAQQDDWSPIRNLNLLDVSKDYQISQLQNEVEVLRQCLSDNGPTPDKNVSGDEATGVSAASDAGEAKDRESIIAGVAAVLSPVVPDANTAHNIELNHLTETQERLEMKLADMKAERDSLITSAAENEKRLEKKLSEVTAEKDSLITSTADNEKQLEKKLSEVTAERDSLLSAVEQLDQQNQAAMEQVHNWRERAQAVGDQLHRAQLLAADRLEQLEEVGKERQLLVSRLEDSDELVAALKTARSELLHQLQLKQEEEEDGEMEEVSRPDQLQMARDEIEQLRRQLLEAFALVEQQQRQQQQLEKHSSSASEDKAHEEQERTTEDSIKVDELPQERIDRSSEQTKEGTTLCTDAHPSVEDPLRSVVHHLCQAVISPCTSGVIADCSATYSRLMELTNGESLTDHDRLRLAALLKVYIQPGVVTTTEVGVFSSQGRSLDNHTESSIRDDRIVDEVDEEVKQSNVAHVSSTADSPALPPISESEERLLELQTEECLRKQLADTVEGATHSPHLRGSDSVVGDKESSRPFFEQLQYERDELHVRVQCLEAELAAAQARDKQQHFSPDGLDAEDKPLPTSDELPSVSRGNEMLTSIVKKDEQTDSCEMRADLSADNEQQTDQCQLTHRLQTTLSAHVRLCRRIGHVSAQCDAINGGFGGLDLEAFDFNSDQSEVFNSADMTCIGELFDKIKSILDDSFVDELISAECLNSNEELVDYAELFDVNESFCIGDKTCTELISSISALCRFFRRFLHVCSALQCRCESAATQCQQLRHQLNRQAVEHKQLLLECQTAAEEQQQQLTEQLQTERCQLEKQLSAIEEENRLREAATQRAGEAQCANYDAERSVWRSEREQLMAALSQKHSESVGYHSEMQRGFQQLQLVTDQMTGVQTQLSDTTEKLQLLQREHDQCAENESERRRLAQELERLQRHLYETEENYTQEALRAEQREIELSNQLRSEMTMSMESELASQRIESLQAELVDVVRQRDDVTLQLDDVTISLTNLQHVLQQFQCEKQRELSLAVSASKREIDELKQQNATIQEKLSEANKGLAAANRLNEQLDRKEDTISALKTEIGKQQERFQRVHIELDEIRSNSSGRVDKSLVRNLVVGWQSAPVRQKRDALRVLATVLDFSADDRQRVRLDSAATSATPGGRRSLTSALSVVGDGDGGAASLSQAFVRFLESESERAPTTTTRADDVSAIDSADSAVSARGTVDDDSALLADAERMALESAVRLESRIQRPSPVPLSPSPLIAAAPLPVLSSSATPGHSRQSSVASTTSNNLLMSAATCDSTTPANILRTIVDGTSGPAGGAVDDK